MSEGLVLSLFPGADVFGMAFELEGFTVVQGPDVIFGRDVRNFHVPAGRFDGVIGGPPCQPFSRLVHIVRANGFEPRHGNLIPEFERIVLEAQPKWFLMEEVPDAPVPSVPGYKTSDFILDNAWLGAVQRRRRRLSFGTRAGHRLPVEVAALESPVQTRAVTGDPRDLSLGQPSRRVVNGRVVSRLPKNGSKSSLAECCELQGLPRTFLEEAPFTSAAKFKLIGNAVPLTMGRAAARAVKEVAPLC